MNSKLQTCRTELAKLKKKDSAFGTELVNIVLNFSRTDKPDYRHLAVVRCSKQLAQSICNKKNERQDYNLD